MNRTWYSTNPTVKNTQSCTTYLSSAFSSYSAVTFSDVSDIQSYLGHFGDLEEALNCAGMCTKLPVYYFSDSNSGEPANACIDKIKTDIIDVQIVGCGMFFIALAALMFLLIFVQYGLCCRRKVKPGMNKNGAPAQRFNSQAGTPGYNNPNQYNSVEQPFPPTKN